MKEFTLELKNGNKLIQSWTLERNKKYIIGRSQDVDIVIDEKSMSRRHAQITVMPGGSASIQDLSSANGTFIDGKAVNANQMVLLRKGAQIVLAEMKTIIFVNEKNIESEDEEEEEEEEKPKVNKKGQDKEAKRENKSHKQARSRSSSPKDQKKNREDSRSRSRSNEKEPESRQIRKGPQITVKLPKRVEREMEEKRKAALLAGTSNKTQDKKGYEDLGLEDEEANKFMKLMGVKNHDKLGLDEMKALPGLKYLRKDMNEYNQQTNRMNEDLERQFERGVMFRRGGRKGGLGSK